MSFKKLQELFKGYSTKQLVDRLIGIQLLCFIIMAITGYLFVQLKIENVLILFGTAMIFLFAGFFLTGLLLFTRKENPYTIAQNWFGKRFPSDGLWPQLTGVFIMLISGSALVAFLLSLIQKLF